MEMIETDELKKESELVIGDAKQIAASITSDAGLTAAAEFLVKIKGMRKKISDKFSPLTKSAYDTWKKIIALEKELDDPLLQAESTFLKPAMGKYQREQEQIRQKAQDELRLRMQQEEEDVRMAQAVVQEQMGNKDVAEAIIAEPVYVAPVILPKPEKTDGVSYKTIWRFEIVNEALIPRQYMMVNQPAIGAIVRAMKGATSIEGIKVFEETSVAVGVRS
jgi:hypothetical protein